MISNSELTIITVVFNGAASLRYLIESMRFNNGRFKWIVIDGASTDGSVDLIRSNLDLVYKFVSEPDGGIYNALNKGVLLCDTAYYLVVGADDLIYRGLFNELREEDFVGFDLITMQLDGVPALKNNRFNRYIRFPFGIVPGHSVGCIIRRDLHFDIGFYDESYLVAADTKFLAKVLLNKPNVSHLAILAGAFGCSGVSSCRSSAVYKEHYRARKEAGMNPVIQSFLLAVSLFRRRFFK